LWEVIEEMVQIGCTLKSWRNHYTYYVLIYVNDLFLVRFVGEATRDIGLWNPSISSSGIRETFW